jgi:hypothetical protein
MNQSTATMKKQESDAGPTPVAMNLEVHVIPVSAVERSRRDSPAAPDTAFQISAVDAP